MITESDDALTVPQGRLLHRRCLGILCLTSFACALLPADEAQAYCFGGDTCPSSDSGHETVTICGNGNCTTSLDVSGANTITLMRFYICPELWFCYYRMGACVYDGSDWQLHGLRHSSYRGSGVVEWSSQPVDMAFCAGGGNDIVRVATASSTCDGWSTVSWNYGSGAYWLGLWGQSGRDSIAGGAGNDQLCGGTGDDDLTVAGGLRGLYGYSSADDLDGWTGNDYMDAYTGAGDQAWGYDGADIVQDLVGSGGGDGVYGEDDTDLCVYIDEAVGSWEINGGRATCDPPSCTCGTTADDSCSDRTLNALSMTIGVEIQDDPFTTFCALD